MDILLILIPLALLIVLVGVLAFVWALKNNQYNDLEGDAQRILFDTQEENDNKQ